MAEVNAVEDQTNTVQKEKKSRNGAWFGLIILLVVIGLAAAGYLLLQQLRDKQQDLGGELSKDAQHRLELSKQISGYQEQLAAIQNQLSNLSSEVSNGDSKFEQRIKEITTLQNTRIDNLSENLTGSINRIQRQLGKTRGDWLVSDAEYLLSVANRRLHLMGDTATTIEALNAADERLRESGDTAGFTVRAQIAKEIAAINKVQVADVVGIYATLDALEEDVTKLSVFLPYAGKGLPADKAKHSTARGTDQQADTVLDKALFELEGIVTVRRLDQPVTSILTIEQKNFIVEQLSTKIGIVKLALVLENDVLYQSSLTDVLQWLEKNFTKDAIYTGFISDLTKLQAIQLRANFPDISQSLKMLRNISKLHLEADKALEGDTVPSSAQ